jgi:hypothetical protein
VVLGRWGSCEALLGGTGPRPKALEKGVVLGNGQDGRTTACSGVREPAVLWPLKAGAAGVAVWAGCLGVRADLGRRAWQEDRRRTAWQYGAVRHSKDGSRSKDGRREGDRGPDLEQWGMSRTNVEAGATTGARRAVQTSPAGCPARRRRSAARPRWFSAGQRDFDCIFLQKVE